MPRKHAADSVEDPVLLLKTLALRDDPRVHKFRDHHYQLVLDSLQATGQRIASGEKVDPLSDTRRKLLLKQHASLFKAICKRYYISGFQGGDPYIVKQNDWLVSIRVSPEKQLRIETNWKTSFFSPRVQFFIPPKNATPITSASGTLYQLPYLQKRPQDSPPVMTLRLNLSQVKRNNLASLAGEFKQAVRRCLDELPKSLRKPPTTWLQNVERDYCRFRLLFYQGVPYRWIAAYEHMKEMPKRPIGVSVRAESSVRETVERVHLILFRKKYKSFRKSFKASKHVSHRADTRLAHVIKSFDCPEHGPDCGFSLSCQYALNFMKKLG